MTGAPCAEAAQIYTYDAGAPAHSNAVPASGAHTRRGSPQKTAPRPAPVAPRKPRGLARAPSAPPLLSAGATEAADSPGGDASSSAPPSGGDPLVENGLGSPLCEERASSLSASSRRNCMTSGFEAAGAPTGNYALDVHIDTGALGFTVSTIEQDYVIGLVWMGLVWIVHTLVVALEWCFTLDLLDSSAMGGIERALRDTQAAFTQPWLVLALALASLAAAYNGLVRRRVTETVGQAALMLAMMACGLWVIIDPTGTVGALGRWVDEASVGTLGVVVEGTPGGGSRTLANSMGGLFTGVIGAPWCYLEFGNVRWCSEPALLDHQLQRAALAIVAAAQSRGGCASGMEEWDTESACSVLEGEQPRARAQSATLLRAARTNGELFLALPANAAARNSINDEASLLRALCGSDHATDCRGETAPEAEFRTQSGTLARLGGLLLIALGALGMLLLLGFIALHLLGAELIGLLYLLLAPAAVIAPALGEGGRAAFRSWATHLAGAVTSKLTFSFLLGVVLLLTRTLLQMSGFGWWTRWLLVSALWWGSYSQRRRALDFLHNERPQLGRQGGGADRHGSHAGNDQSHRHATHARLLKGRFESPRAALASAQWVREKLTKPPPHVERRQTHERARREPMRTNLSGQATRMLAVEHEQAIAQIGEAPRVEAGLGEKRSQLTRVRAAHERALAAGQTRRAARLGVRAQRVEGEIAHTQGQLNTARETVAAGAWTQRTTGRRHTRAAVDERARFLDAQAQLPARGRVGRVPGDPAATTARRDYAALASLAGIVRPHYEQLDARRQREARLRIDRELALRRGGTAAVRVAGRPPTQAAGRTTTRAAGHGAVRTDRSHLDSHRGRFRPAASTETPESTVMRDAREVARGRKSHLGG